MYYAVALSSVHVHSSIGFWNEIKGAWKEGNRTQMISVELLEKLLIPQLVKKFPTFYVTRRLITVFVRAICFYIEPDQSTPSPHSIIWRSILISHSHQSQCLASGPLLAGFSSKTLYASLRQIKGNILSNRNWSIGYTADVKKDHKISNDTNNNSLSSPIIRKIRSHVSNYHDQIWKDTAFYLQKCLWCNRLTVIRFCNFIFLHRAL